MTRRDSYREVEQRYWEHLGTTPSEEWIDHPRTGTRVRLQVAGDGPPVLFLHGVNTCGTVWAPLAARLDGLRCVLVDRPGCGLSDPLAEPVTTMRGFESLGDDVVAGVLDAIGLKRAPIVATSLGGYFAFRAAAAHPDRITALVQMGWSVGAPNGDLPLVMRLGGSQRVGRLMARMPMPRAAVRPMLRRIGLREAVDAGSLPAAGEDWFHALLSGTSTMRNELDASPQLVHPWRGMTDDVLFSDELLASIRAPVTFLWGEGDPFGGAEVADTFAAKVPGSALTVMPNAGHAVWMDDVDLVAAAVRAAV